MYLALLNIVEIRRALEHLVVAMSILFEQRFQLGLPTMDSRLKNHVIPWLTPWTLAFSAIKLFVHVSTNFRQT